CHSFPHQWKHLSRAGMKQQWLIIDDEVLVERESAGAFDPERRIDAIDPLCNLMHIGPGLAVRHGHFAHLFAICLTTMESRASQPAWLRREAALGRYNCCLYSPAA